MTEILIYTADGKKSLLLQPGTTVQINETSAIFDETLSDGMYSLPISVPAGGMNSRLLSHPEVNTSGTVPSWDVDVVENGIPQLSKAKMVLLKFNGSYNGTAGTYSMSITGTINRFATAIQNKTLRDLNLGGKIIFPANLQSRNFAQWVMTGNDEETLRKLSFAPVLWKGFIDQSREDFSTEALHGDIINHIIAGPNGGGNWVFARADDNNPNVPIQSGQPGYSDYKTIPFFRLSYVLRSIFEEHGYSLQGDLLNDADFQKIHICNNYSLEVCLAQNNVDANRSITPSNHMPPTLIADVIGAISIATGMAFDFDDSGKVTIRQREKELLPGAELDMSAYCDPEVETTLPDLNKNGVNIDWDWDNGDSFIGDKVKEIDITDANHIVQTKQQIAAILGTEDGEKLYCESENWYYEWSAINQEWKYYSEGQQPYTYRNENDKKKIGMSPVLQGKGLDENGNAYDLDMVGLNQPGSYYNYAFKHVDAEFGFRIFFIDMLSQAGFVLPTSYSHSRASNGDQRSRFSLNLCGKDNIIAAFSEKWVKAVDGSYMTEANIRLPQTMTPKYLLRKRMRLGNNTYLPISYEFVIGENRNVRLKMMMR